MLIKKKSTELLDTIKSSLREDPHRRQAVWESDILEYSVKCQKRKNKSESLLTYSFVQEEWGLTPMYHRSFTLALQQIQNAGPIEISWQPFRL